MSSQESSFASAAIQGISKAGTQAAADLSKDPEKFAAMSKQIMNTGITTASSILGGADSTKLISLASDMARGAASGLAGQNNGSLSSQVSNLATYAVAAVNESSTTNRSSGSITSILTSFATNVGGAISAGLAVGGESAESITAMTSTLSNSIVQSVVVYAPTVDTTSLGQQVTAEAKMGAASVSSVPQEVPAPPLLIIASGAARTPISTVSLALTATNASEMYITNSIGCTVGGTWETFSTSKMWNLAQANSLATVYAKVRNQLGTESPCSSASILHDNFGPTSPSLIINAGAPVTNLTQVYLALSASEASEMYITNSPGCSSGSTWETYSVTKTWTLGQTNGTGSVYAKFRDQLGNESSCTSASIIHDGSIPTVTSILMNAGAAITSTTAVTLSITALGATQMLITNNSDCSTGGSWTNFNPSNSWTLAQSNSLSTVYVKLRNAFLVESACIPTSIIHDNTAPNPGAIAINSGASATANVAVTLSFNATDAISMYITNTAGCNAGGNWESYGTTRSWTLGQTNAVATVYAKFLDSIGNESPCISSSITHDSTAPQTPEIIINNYNSLTSSALVTLTLSVSDATEMYITNTAGCSTGGVWETYSATRSWTLPSLNSTNYVYAKFRDFAGNESSCDSDDIIHDDTPPGSIGISINSGGSTTQSYNVSLGLSATGASHMFLTNTPSCSGGGSWESFNAAKPWVLGQGGGVATVYGKFKDLAGNVSSCTSDSITSTAPAVLAISGGDRFSCAILTGGVLKCWGLNWDGKLGSENGTMYGNSANSMGINLPAVNLGTGRIAVKVSTGLSHSCAILDNGQVKCWGSCLYGQLGKVCTDFIGDSPAEMGDNLTPIDLGTGRTAREISAYGSHTCAVLDNYSLKCWGKNAYGQLGLGDTNDRGDAAGEMGDNLPTVNLGTGRTAKSVVAGGYLTCAILDNDSLKCWGHNGNGPLGRGDTTQIGDNANEMGDNNTGVNLGIGRTVKAVVAGDRHICVHLDNDTVKCLGDNAFGQLGIATNTNIGDSPGEIGDSLNVSLVGSGRSVVKVAGSWVNNCVILDNGALKCWGTNSDGQLGLGDTALRGNAAGQMGDNLPSIDLGTGRTAINVTVGKNHVCVVLDNGSVKCWGYGFFGTLGQGNTADIGKIANQMGDYLLPIDL
jgi:alpha-tubulin suppressor-like RCC1 family protein